MGDDLCQTLGAKSEYTLARFSSKVPAFESTTRQAQIHLYLVIELFGNSIYASVM